MVGVCRSIYSAISGASLDYLLTTLFFCAIALHSWRVSWTTESTAYKIALAANRVDTQKPLCTIEYWSQSVVDNVQSLTRLGNRTRQPSRICGGTRTLKFHGNSMEAIVPDAEPRQESAFEGLLAQDGSISSSKLLLEGDQFEEYHPVNRNERASNNAGTRAPGQHRANPPVAVEKTYRPCPGAWRDLIPCSNVSGHLYGQCSNTNLGRGTCAISAPAFYARQFWWPASKKQIRGLNVPDVPLLRDLRHQAWMQTTGQDNVTINFVEGEPRFPNGLSRYFDDLALMIPELSFGTNTRLVLDIGCGTGNVAAALDTRQVLTLSIAGEGSTENGVQLVLERGFPALLQSILTHRLPYPSQAFDLLHCAACDVQWVNNGGSKLLEADRILRGGGYFVWMDPSDVGANWNVLEELTKGMCWTNVAKWGRFSVWQKPTNQTCYLLRVVPTPPLCDDLFSPDASWNVPLQSCLVGLLETEGAIAHPWPSRLEIPPWRLQQAPTAGIGAAKPEVYKADLNYWKFIVAFYATDFGPIRPHEVHNVLDMNAGYGGFAAAVSLTNPLQWWVLNVVPVDQPDRLALIFDRGLLGIYHDWCESLDVHPRTFDMLHSSQLFSSFIRCEMSDIVQEMDRLLRPGGFAVIRDQEEVLLQVQTIARALHWKTTVEDTESGPKGKDKVLSCQKTFWQPVVGTNGEG